jgi:mercuric ion transport protein
MKPSKEKIFLGGATIAAIASSLCCILPVLAIAFGLGAFGVASLFEAIRPYLLAIAFLALAFAFYRLYFRGEACVEGQTCSTKAIGRFNQIILWVATIAIVTISFFPYYTSYIVSALDRQRPQTEESSQPSITVDDGRENGVVENADETATVESETQNRNTVVIEVEGMTCEGCASHINIELKRIKGVISAEANYREKNVRVVYNTKQVTIERIKQAINDAGYKAK